MNKIFVALSSVVLGTFLSSPASSQQEHKWEFTESAGNRIAWSCVGEGQPTTVMIAGGGLSAHDSFGRIYHNYDGPRRLCMYDRAGLGESKFVEPKTRTLDQLVNELHILSTKNAWEDALVVAHSFGGFIARAYADKYPTEVRGILFLDVAQEDWLPRLNQRMSASDW